MTSPSEVPLDGPDKTRRLLDALRERQGVRAAAARRIPRRPVGEACPLSFAQARLWFLDQLAPRNPFYNLAAPLRLQLVLNHAALERSVNEIVRRHETLRTTFRVVSGEPVQIVAPILAVPLPIIDLRDRPPETLEAEVLRLAIHEAQQGFDLSSGPLLRTVLVQTSEVDYVFLLTVHHIVSDAWSVGVFFQELSVLYAAFATGQASPLPELPIQYGDFAVWQRQWLQGEVLERQLAYWKGKLAEVPALALPTDRPRPPLPTYVGDQHLVSLPGQLSSALKALSQSEGATVFMTLLAALQVLLHRYSSQEDFAIGSPISGRNRVELEGPIGFFVNTVALRADLSGDPTFRELLRRVRNTALEAYAHQDLPFDVLVERLHPERDLARNPLFQVMFQIYSAPARPASTQMPSQRPIEVKNNTAKFDLFFNLWDYPEEISGLIEYSTDLFDGESIARMAGHFQTILEAVATNPDLRVAEIPMMTAAERSQIVELWNATMTGSRGEATVPDLFEAEVEAGPDRVALVFGDEALNYDTVNRRANQLAHELQAMGIGNDILVGVLMERSLDQVVAILAILKAGGAYVPLDPTYPRERLVFMIADAGIVVVIAEAPLLDRLPDSGVRIVSLDRDRARIAARSDANPQRSIAPTSLAYVMFTSGSTGEPKGVAVPHRAVVRLVKETNYVRFGSDEVFLHLASPSFDASTFEIWGSLLNGARLVIFPSGPVSLKEVGRALERYRVTTLWLTAGLFNQMVEERLESLRPVRQLLAGGDVLSVPHVQKALKALDQCQLINGYGPTEGTTFSCCHPISRETALVDSVPIGRPIANTTVYILDASRQPVPVGVPGELYIGGRGLARGYVNRPDLTAEKFVPNPFSGHDGARLYRTGDLARYRSDGTIQFLGRSDDQVKVHGFRVEPGEIEAALTRHRDMRSAIVMAPRDPSGERYLVAYFVARSPAPSPAELQDFLRERLPAYMIPFVLVPVDAFPLTPNGKVDRAALAKLVRRPGGPMAHAAPSTGMEEMLLALWKDVFGLEQISTDDNFFDLGGHSLLMAKVHSRLAELLDQPPSIVDLFRYPTIRALAGFLGAERSASPPPPSSSRIQERAEKQRAARGRGRRGKGKAS